MHRSAIQAKKSPEYSSVLDRLSRALSNEPLSKALTTSVQILRESSDHFDWVGIYLVRGNDLVLEAYAWDKKTEHVRIPIGEGICGSAAKEGATIVVPDVSKDPSYLMCFATTRSDRRPDKGKERSPRRDRYRQQSTIRLQPRRSRDS